MANLPVPVPRTFAVSETETGSYLNTLRDALNFLLNPPLASLTQSATQSVTNATWTSITFDVSVVDSYGGHSNVTNNTRYTAQVAGWYLASGAVAFAVNATGSRGVCLSKTGTRVQGGATFAVSFATNSPALCTPTLPVFLNVGDYLEIQCYQTSGGALSTLAAADLNSSMGISWLHS